MTDFQKDTVYQELCELISSAANIPKEELQPETRVYHDLGLIGEDAYLLMEAFSKQFQVNMDKFTFDHFFPPEFVPDPLGVMFLICSRLSPQNKTVNSVINFFAHKKAPLRTVDLYRAAKTRVWPADLSDREPESWLSK